MPDGQAAVWRTHDAGASWIRADAGLPTQDAYLGVLREAMARDELDPVGVYFGTSTGQLYGSADGGVSWSSIAPTLPPDLVGRGDRRLTPMAAVILPRSLAALIPGVEHRTTAPGTTVGEVIAALDARWPGVADRLCEAGPRIRDHINVFVDGERTMRLDQAVSADTTIHVIPAIAGGAQTTATTEAAGVQRDIVSWEELDRLVAGLAEKVRGDYDAMLAITRGGMVPAGMLAYRLGIRDILVAAVAYYDDTGTPGPEPTFLQFPADPLLRGRRVLVVDEVWDSGATIHAVTERVRQAGGIPTTVVVHYKPGRSVVPSVPDHFAVSTDAWVVYPFKAGR